VACASFHDESNSLEWVMSTQRELARDARGRIGEIMERRDTARGTRVWLRPIGGGREWTASADTIEILRSAESER
jgi:hypothetical protein